MTILGNVWCWLMHGRYWDTWDGWNVRWNFLCYRCGRLH